MKRATFLYAIATFAVTVSLYLSLGLFLPGCSGTTKDGVSDSGGGAAPGTPKSRDLVNQSGSYMANCADASGKPRTVQTGDYGVGVLTVGNCAKMSGVTLVKAGASANLTITKMAAPLPAMVGQPLTYTITVSNNTGPDTALDVLVIDTLPTDVTLFSVSPDAASFPAGSGGCTSSNPSVTPITVKCDPLGTITSDVATIPPGTSAQFQITVTPNVAETILNTATVQTSVFNTNMANNTVQLPTMVSAPGCKGNADLAANANAPSTSGGFPFTVFIQTGNFLGPDTAQNVITTDTLSGPAKFTSVSSVQGTCTMAATVVSCTFGPILKYPAEPSHPDVFITVTPTGTPGMIINTIFAKSDTCDPTPSDGNDKKMLTTTSP